MLEQIDAEQEETVYLVCFVGRLGSFRFVFGSFGALGLQGKKGNTESHESYNRVLVEGIALAEESNVQEHDREQFARFGQEEGDVVNMF